MQRWRQAFEQGRDLAPDDLCPGRPDLAEQLRRAVEPLRATLPVLVAEGPATLVFPPDQSEVTLPPELIESLPTVPPFETTSPRAPFTTLYHRKVLPNELARTT